MGGASFADSSLEFVLAERYLPYVEGRDAIFGESDSSEETAGNWWSEPTTVRAAADGMGGELKGLHLALDPGHIGGTFAREEGREFKIEESDFSVREGDLVLMVARMIEAELTQKGARVTLLRTGPEPVNQVNSSEQLKSLLARLPQPEGGGIADLAAYAMLIRKAYFQEVYVKGEIEARAALINEVIRPDAVLSLHINAAPWPAPAASTGKRSLVKSNHGHVLIFGCVSGRELRAAGQEAQVRTKVLNGSGPIELELGAALGEALGRALHLPPSSYEGPNAYPMPQGSGYVWARNLLLLRRVECPVVLLEPFLANSVEGYGRLQAALGTRAAGEPLAEDDILQVYARAVVEGILQVYGPVTDGL